MLNKIINHLKNDGIILTDVEIKNEITFLEELLKWNKKVNLTSITDFDEALEKHICDSLYLLPYIKPHDKVMDIGSGPGIPAIPLAIVKEKSEFLTVESVGKKNNFQKHIRRLLGLHNLNIFADRAENLLQNNKNDMNLITSRAFSSLVTFLDLAVPLVKKNGLIVAMKGPDVEEELMELETKKDTYPIILDETFKYSLPVSQSKRQLLIFKKLTD